MLLPPVALPVRLLAVALLAAGLLVRPGRATPGSAAGLLLVAVVAGFALGGLRLAAIDGQAYRSGPQGSEPVRLSGFVEADPSRSRGVLRLRLATPAGRLMVQAADPGVAALPRTGQRLLVSGRAGPGPGWYRPVLRRHGLVTLLKAGSLRPLPGRRGGLTGWLDRARDRAVNALQRGLPAREAALARGFVLGQDSVIDSRTAGDFRAAGLSHLLAVSGQNVVLLGLLAGLLLTLTRAGPQLRRVGVVLVILAYIPLAGGEASIQRAGVMGIAGLVATGTGRATSRLWAVTLAAAVTLALDPRAVLDPGWQLSFAAVAGIATLAGPLRMRLEGVTGTGRAGRALAEGAAVTLAATLATAPLISFHFGRFPAGTVIANLAVLPAVAPAMWLGMLSAAVGQLWAGLALPFNLANSPVLAMIAAVAARVGRADGAELNFDLGWGGLVFAVAGGTVAVLLLLRRWRPPPEDPGGTGLARRRRRAVIPAVLVVGLWLAVGSLAGTGGRRQLAAPAPGGVRIELLDVGQGDAILIRPDRALPLLIDGGPPGGDLRGALRSAGANHLAAVLLTHPDLDHYGGLLDLFPGVKTDRLLYDRAPPDLLAAAREAGTRPVRVGEGQKVRLGSGVALNLLWPPRDPGRAGDPADAAGSNRRSVIGLLSWHRFRMYLPGDGEAESVPVDPGPHDVLKVAHHGSSDTGLPGLLARSRPRAALIGVGAGNRYGHPAEATIAELAAAGVPVYRTDRDGTVSVIPEPGGFRIETGR